MLEMGGSAWRRPPRHRSASSLHRPASRSSTACCLPHALSRLHTCHAVTASCTCSAGCTAARGTATAGTACPRARGKRLSAPLSTAPSGLATCGPPHARGTAWWSCSGSRGSQRRRVRPAADCALPRSRPPSQALPSTGCCAMPALPAAGSPVSHVPVCHEWVLLDPCSHLGLVCAAPDQHAARGGAPHGAPQHQLARIRLRFGWRAVGGGWADGRQAQERASAHHQPDDPPHPTPPGPQPTHHLAAAPQVLIEVRLPPRQQLRISVPACMAMGCVRSCTPGGGAQLRLAAARRCWGDMAAGGCCQQARQLQASAIIHNPNPNLTRLTRNRTQG